MNFRQASNSRALASVTRVIASGSCSSILRSIWSSSFSQSLMARKARREPSARKSLTLKTESRAIRQPRTTRAVSSSPDKSSLRVSAGRVRASAGRDRAEVECRFGRAGGDGRFLAMGNSRNSKRRSNYNEASIKRECESNVNVNVNEHYTRSRSHAQAAANFSDISFPALRPARQRAWHLALCRVRDRRERATGERRYFSDQIWRTLRDPARRRQNRIAEFALPPVPGVRYCCSNRQAARPRTGRPRSSRLLAADKRGRVTGAPTFGWARVSSSIRAHPAPRANRRTSPAPRPIRTQRWNHRDAVHKPASSGQRLWRNLRQRVQARPVGGARLASLGRAAAPFPGTGARHSIDCRRWPAWHCAADSELRFCLWDPAKVLRAWRSSPAAAALPSTSSFQSAWSASSSCREHRDSSSPSDRPEGHRVRAVELRSTWYCRRARRVGRPIPSEGDSRSRRRGRGW